MMSPSATYICHGCTEESQNDQHWTPLMSNSNNKRKYAPIVRAVKAMKKINTLLVIACASFAFRNL